MSEPYVSILINGTRQKLTITEAVATKQRIAVALARSSVKCGACGALVLPFAKCPMCGCSR